MRQRMIAAMLAGAGAVSAAAAEPPRPINLPPRMFPESVTSTRDGTLLIGSTELGGVFRAARGSARAEPWIKADAANDLGTVFGVLADEPAGSLWLCSNDLARTGKGAAIKAFALRTGAFRRSYDLPGAMCNDMAVDGAGTLYATDMNGRVLRLGKGASQFEPWVSSPLLKSADGIAIAKDGRVLVNTFGPGKLYAIRPAADGTAGPVTEIRLSRALSQPDGMRTGRDGAIYLAEGGGRATKLRLSGDTAEAITLAEGLNGPAGITLVSNRPWIVEGKVAFRMNPALKDKDPGPFRVLPMPEATK